MDEKAEWFFVKYKKRPSLIVFTQWNWTQLYICISFHEMPLQQKCLFIFVYN